MPDLADEILSTFLSSPEIEYILKDIVSAQERIEFERGGRSYANVWQAFSMIIPERFRI